MNEVTLHLGDCLEILPTLAAGSVDAVITDPPYMLNVKSGRNGRTNKVNPWADRVNMAYWYSAWMERCKGLTFPDGCMWSFMNWRSMVTFQKAADDIGWMIDSMLIWDKCWIGPGGPKGLRPSYEMVALWCGDDFAIEDRGLPDIQRFTWSSHKPTGHPAEKPLDLIKWIVSESTDEGDTILDPFMGSGTTGVACMQTGRNFIGIEIDSDYYAIAEKRIKAAQAQLVMPI